MCQYVLDTPISRFYAINRQPHPGDWQGAAVNPPDRGAHNEEIGVTLFDQIAASAQIDNLDDAIRPIQEILGQSDGGIASQFFSDADENAWAHAVKGWRMALLNHYVRHEVAMSA